MFNVWDFLLFVVATTYTPGPNNLTGMALAGTYGIKRTVKFALGVAIAFILMMLVCCLFNQAINAFIPVAKYYLASAGALYMLYLAVKTLRSKPHDAEKKPSRFSGVPQGIFQTLVNPKAIFYVLTVCTSFITPYFHTVPAYLLFGAGLGAFSSISVVTWGLFGMAIQKFFSKYRTAVNIVMALLLVYCAYAVFMGMFHVPPAVPAAQ